MLNNLIGLDLNISHSNELKYNIDYQLKFESWIVFAGYVFEIF